MWAAVTGPLTHSDTLQAQLDAHLREDLGPAEVAAKSLAQWQKRRQDKEGEKERVIKMARRSKGSAAIREVSA